jgi:hypothetical protein
VDILRGLRWSRPHAREDMRSDVHDSIVCEAEGGLEVGGGITKLKDLIQLDSSVILMYTM